MRALRASSVVRWINQLCEVGFSVPQAEALVRVIQDMYEDIAGEREVRDANE